MNKAEFYIRNGKYNAHNGCFIYYEVAPRHFWAEMNAKEITVCYGPLSGDCEYWDLDKKHKENLLKIIDADGFDTRKLLKYVRDNDMNKKAEVKNGLGVKLNLFKRGVDGNAFSLLGLFRKTAQRQGFTDEQINPIIEDAKKGDYSHLVYTLTSNCN